MKVIVVMVIMAVFSGCGALSRARTRWTGELTYKCSRAGVEYVQSDSGLALSVDMFNHVILCK